MADRAACVCPDIEPIGPTDAVPIGPILCRCCGGPLVITCPGECGAEHVRASIDGVRETLAKEKKEKPLRRCGRCGREIPKRNGRPPKVCDDCLTPAERTDRKAGRKYQAKMRGRAQEATS